MSQKKVDQYKKNKNNRTQESRKEIRSMRIEIGILIAVIIAGVAWFIVAGVTNSMNSRMETVELNISALDNYVYSLSSDTAAGDDQTEAAEGDSNVIELTEDDLAQDGEIVIGGDETESGETQSSETENSETESK